KGAVSILGTLEPTAAQTLLTKLQTEFTDFDITYEHGKTSSLLKNLANKKYDLLLSAVDSNLIDHLLPLDSYIARTQFSPDNHVTLMLDNSKIRGETYALPIVLFPTLLAYNADIFDRYGVPYP